MISFVGAGPGAADLITVRGRDRLAAADVVVWASSLVPEALLDHAPPTAEIHDSAGMTLEDVRRGLLRASRRPHRAPPLRRPRDLRRDPGTGRLVRRARARLRDRARRELARRGRRGSAARADDPDGGAERRAHPTRRPYGGIDAGARVGRRLRRSRHDDGRVPVRGAAGRAAAGAARRRERLLGRDAGRRRRARRPGPTSRSCTTTVGGLADDLDAIGATRTVLVLVGPALRGAAARSHLYAPQFAHMFRRRSRPESTVGRPAMTPRAATREPDLAPEVAARTKGLRAGWTTGTCASAAAKAGAVGLAERHGAHRGRGRPARPGGG